MKVIILSKTNYKEKDCIYNAINEHEYFSFQAKGAQDNKSPVVWLNNPLTVADIEFLEDGRYKHKVLKTAVLVSTSFGGNDRLEYLYTIGALAELTNNALTDEEKPLMFKDLIDAMNALKSDKDPIMVLLIYIAKLLKQVGTELEVDRCVSCGSIHDIVVFSFSDGGFLCRNCVNEDTVYDLKPQQMRLVRYAFKAKDYSCVKAEDFEKADKQTVLKRFKEFLDEYHGANIKSINHLL